MRGSTLTESYRPADTGVPLSDHPACLLLADRATSYPDRLALFGARRGDGEASVAPDLR